jgi:3,4-dihydroxy 2-butanone 4-phosphate synthase/GTP cyclohydrolase II
VKEKKSKAAGPRAEGKPALSLAARQSGSPFARIEDAVAAVRAGRMIIIVDDADRENEGDLMIAAEKVTPEAINFMARYGRGLICLSMTPERLDQLDIPLMVSQNSSKFDTAFCVPVEARDRTSTGISAADRAATVLTAIDPETKPADLLRPGHMFPLRSRTGGVLVRTGQTEASVDIARIAGLNPSGVICEVMNEDGTMARLPELIRVAREHDLKLISIADLIQFRRHREVLVKKVAEAAIPTFYGEFRSYAYESTLDERTHIALVYGDIGDGSSVLTRVHSECLTGDVFASLRCDCGEQLQRSMEKVAAEGRGVVLYIRGHEGRAIGLTHKLRAYELQDRGRDTVEANLDLGLPVDQRDYGIGAQILFDIGVRTMRLLTNNPSKRAGLEGYGLSIEERIPLQTKPTAQNIGYLRTKREKLGHLLDVPEVVADREEGP